MACLGDGGDDGAALIGQLATGMDGQRIFGALTTRWQRPGRRRSLAPQVEWKRVMAVTELSLQRLAGVPTPAKFVRPSQGPLHMVLEPPAHLSTASVSASGRQETPAKEGVEFKSEHSIFKVEGCFFKRRLGVGWYDVATEICPLSATFDLGVCNPSGVTPLDCVSR
jgi:hypothetical protein